MKETLKRESTENTAKLLHALNIKIALFLNEQEIAKLEPSDNGIKYIGILEPDTTYKLILTIPQAIEENLHSFVIIMKSSSNGIIPKQINKQPNGNFEYYFHTNEKGYLIWPYNYMNLTMQFTDEIQITQIILNFQKRDIFSNGKQSEHICHLCVQNGFIGKIRWVNMDSLLSDFVYDPNSKETKPKPKKVIKRKAISPRNNLRTNNSRKEIIRIFSDNEEFSVWSWILPFLSTNPIQGRIRKIEKLPRCKPEENWNHQIAQALISATNELEITPIELEGKPMKIKFFSLSENTGWGVVEIDKNGTVVQVDVKIHYLSIIEPNNDSLLRYYENGDIVYPMGYIIFPHSIGPDEGNLRFEACRVFSRSEEERDKEEKLRLKNLPPINFAELI